MKKFTIVFSVLLFFSFIVSVSGFAGIAPSVSQKALRSEEILRKEETLRKRIEEPPKSYVKKIVIEGSSILSEEEIAKISQRFEKRWLTKQEIQQVLDLIKEVYKEKGYPEKIGEITAEVKGKTLKIMVAEALGK
jgi:hemolysin activation/secretion protein